MINFERIREHLETQRKERRLGFLSEEIGVDYRTLNRLSHGNQNIRFRTVRQISDYLESRKPEKET